jgi:acetoin utilization deacetylase AcuC-like enzyme
MLPFKLFYSDAYDLNLGQHVFQAQKYRLIHDRLLRERFAEPSDFIEPEPATDEDVLLVHEPAWVDKLRHGTLSFHEILKLEIPYSRKAVEACWQMAGGTIQAARAALRDGFGLNIGGGFHHAFAAHGEGFCAIHDVAIGVRRVQKDGQVKRAMIVDTDVHQGNGTAAIFADDPDVFTISIHQQNNYPYEKPPSNIDINLEDGVGDTEYLQRLEAALAPAVASFQPELLMHVSGADPYMEDQLGGLLLTLDGLSKRDHLVYEIAMRHRVPVCITLAGGYAFNPHDTVVIHSNTAKAAAHVVGQVANLPAGWQPAENVEQVANSAKGIERSDYGFPTFRCARPVTTEDVRNLKDED